MVAAVIGDIHGQADLLATLIETLRSRFGQNISLHHVGDMVDRGPDARGVVQLCIDHKIQGVMGNHETWLHKYLTTGQFDDFALHRMMRGDATLRSYGVESRNPGEIERQLGSRIPEPHRQYILSLPLWRKIPMKGCTYRVLHTGLKDSDATAFRGAAERNAGKFNGSVSDALCDAVATTTPASILWNGPNLKEPNLYRFPDGSCQIFGHSPVRKPILTKWWIAIDTGSGTRPPYALSAVVLPSREIVTVNSLTGKTGSDGGFTDFTL